MAGNIFLSQYPTNIGHRASGIGHRASGIGHRASGIFCKLASSKVLLFILLSNFLFGCFTSHAQINAVTPNSYHTPISYSAFQVPTATDLAFINGNALQAVIATTPTPTLYWDDNNGNKGNYSILNAPTLPTNPSAIYVDDIAITYNPFGDIYAYVTCRALLANSTTEIHLLTFQWFSNMFNLIPGGTLQDTRPTTTDPFDAVKIDARASDNVNTQFNGDIVLAYSKNGNTYATWGTVNFANGSLTGVQANQFVMQGVNPDVSIAYGSLVVNQTLGSFLHSRHRW